MLRESDNLHNLRFKRMEQMLADFNLLPAAAADAASSAGKLHDSNIDTTSRSAAAAGNNLKSANICSMRLNLRLDRKSVV